MEYDEDIARLARELNDEQIENILPGYKNIYNQIKRMRNYAKLYNYDNKYKNKDYINITMNNVFSILGKRGAGKSSILLTLKDNSEKNKNDIVLPIILPIILPETMRNKGDIMGWILGCFKKTVDELSKEEARQYNYEKNNGVNFGNCRKDEESTEVRKKYNEVLKQYSYTRKDYADIIKDNYTGLKEYIDKSRKILDPENELKRSFFELINQLIKIKKESSTNKEIPMIYMFLDDIDLTKKHCNEILGVISRYLCHPNIIVFVSGDYEIFETEQFMSYMKSNNLMDLVVSPVDNNRYGEKIFNENRMLARDALKKIMPPAYRYKLRSLSPKERLKFYYGKDKEKSLERLLEEKFKILNKDKKTGELEESKIEVINAYGLIFDEMPRGIMNVYYALNNIENIDILSKHGEKSNEYKGYISDFKNFVNTIIHSSTVLSNYEDEINACIQINNNFTETFVNYKRLVNQIKDKNDKYYTNKDMKDNINHGIIIVLIFAHFIESIVRVVDVNRKVHSQKQVWEILSQKESLFNDNDKTKLKFKIYPQIKDTNFIFNLYESMLSNDALNIMPTMDNLYLKDYSLKFYFEKIIDEDWVYTNKGEKSDMDFGDKIYEIGEDDYQWVEEKFRVIYYHRNILSMMFNKAINRVKIHNYNYKNIIENKFNSNFYYKIINQLDSGANENEKVNIDDIYMNINISGNDKEERKNKMNEEIANVAEMLTNILKKELENIIKEIGESNDNIKRIKSVNIDNYEELLEKIQIYFANLNMHIQWKLEADYKNIIYLSVICNVLKYMNSISDYEKGYFAYFQFLHMNLKDNKVYEEWCKSREDISPLTLILENK